MKLILFGTLGCHLCEQAEMLLRPLATQHHVDFWIEDIADRDEWMERFAIRIPVLQYGSVELDWPFTEEQLSIWFSLNVLSGARTRKATE